MPIFFRSLRGGLPRVRSHGLSDKVRFRGKPRCNFERGTA